MRTGRRILVAAGVAVLAIQVAVIAVRRAERQSDFDIAREFGRRFLAGEDLYRGGLHFPYLPAAALVHAPLALIPANVGFALRYVAAIGLLALTLRMLGRMLPFDAVTGEDRVAIAAAAAVLGLQYVLRDLGEAGPHLILLALVVGGFYAARAGHTVLAAFPFGLAIAVKTPLAILLPFLAWKRRWSLLAATAVATTLWIAAPAAWMGARSWTTHHVAWARSSLSFIAPAGVAPPAGAGEPEIDVQAIEEWPNNQSLRAVLVRNLPSRPIPSELAATLLTAGLVAGIAWWMRRPLDSSSDPAWIREIAALLILAALLSPIAWRQHLVFALPALYLIAAEHRVGAGLGKLAAAALGVYAFFALVLNREILGRDLSYRAHGYGIHALAMLLVLGILIGSVRSKRRATAP